MTTAGTSAQTDPENLVARMIGELNANPEARTLLLRALLTDDSCCCLPRWTNCKRTSAT